MYDTTNEDFTPEETNNVDTEANESVFDEVMKAMKQSVQAKQDVDVKSILPGGCVIRPEDAKTGVQGAKRETIERPAGLEDRVTQIDQAIERVRIPQETARPYDEAAVVAGVAKELVEGKIGEATKRALFAMSGEELKGFVDKVNEHLKKWSYKLSVDDAYMIVCGDPKTQGHYFQGRYATLTDLKTGKAVSSTRVRTVEDFKLDKESHRIRDILNQNIERPSVIETNPRESQLPSARPRNPESGDANPRESQLPTARPGKRPTESGDANPRESQLPTARPGKRPTESGDANPRESQLPTARPGKRPTESGDGNPSESLPTARPGKRPTESGDGNPSESLPTVRPGKRPESGDSHPQSGPAPAELPKPRPSDRPSDSAPAPAPSQIHMLKELLKPIYTDHRLRK